jgi:hypothetical protein
LGLRQKIVLCQLLYTVYLACNIASNMKSIQLFRSVDVFHEKQLNNCHQSKNKMYLFGQIFTTELKKKPLEALLLYCTGILT